MPLDWLVASDATLARFIVQRGLAIVYLIAFVVALRQFPALLGERGLLPVPAFLRRMPFRVAPTLFQLGYSDRRLAMVAWSGVGLAVLAASGLAEAAPLPVAMAIWFGLWLLYLSIVNVGQTFYAFGWESLLLEAGFLAIFLGNAETAAPLLVLVLFRWLAFRVEFGAGLIKLRGDPCWRDLTCLDYHHETQPLPNPLSWYAHRAPRRFHRVEVVGNHLAQLVVPIGLLLPQPIAGIAAGYMILTQLYLVLTGNYAWLNWVTIIVTAAALPDAILPGAGSVAVAWPFAASAAPVTSAGPPWFELAVGALTALVVVLSYWPVRNLMGGHQLMNFSFNPFHLVNTYGAFGSVTRQRDEIVVEGTDAPEPDGSARWREYPFKAKPGDPHRRPPQVAPYHLRLDWLMWFLPLAPYRMERWFVRFVEHLLGADPLVLGLLAGDPFEGRRPTFVRAVLYRYRYSTWTERRRTGVWWTRERIGDYLPPVRLEAGRAG